MEYRQEVRKPLTSLQYVMVREQLADPSYESVSRQRINFVYKNKAFNIDIYDNIEGLEKAYILRFNNNEKVDGKTVIPPFIEFIRDVRMEKGFQLVNIAKKKEE